MKYIKWKNRYINLDTTHEIIVDTKTISFYHGGNSSTISFESNEDCIKAIRQIEEIIQKGDYTKNVVELEIENSKEGALSIHEETGF